MQLALQGQSGAVVISWKEKLALSQRRTRLQLGDTGSRFPSIHNNNDSLTVEMDKRAVMVMIMKRVINSGK